MSEDKKIPTNLSLRRDTREYLERLSHALFGLENLSMTLDFIIHQIKDQEFKITIDGDNNEDSKQRD